MMTTFYSRCGEPKDNNSKSNWAGNKKDASFLNMSSYQPVQSGKVETKWTEMY